ncbi:MAG TPA: TonB family protein [Pyrinomonadaceae bacterium]|nr:TonB family protein [Pyrinomonadaceae bacterium]
MSKRILLSLSIPLLLSFAPDAPGQAGVRSIAVRPVLSRTIGASSEREQDGLNGPVRRVRTETAKLSSKNGKLVEGQRVTLEVAAYDIKGAKIENAYYPVSGAAVTGKEVYKYDDKGNIVEMTLQDEKGTLLSKETYTYEFDQFGNWVKMTTSVAVIENGKLTFEPTEVTYRAITYYLDEATLAKMSQPAQAPAVTTPANTGGTAGTAANTPATNNAATGNASASNASKPASGAQPDASLSSKPAAQTSEASNNSSPASKQPTQIANNKPASSDSSKQPAMQPTTSPASTAQVVKTSAPVTDKPAETKSSEEMATKPVIKPLLKPVSGGVLNGKALNLPKPVYPLAAKSTRMGGVVVVEVVIDVNGKVISARAISGPGLLQQAAVQAAYQAKFSPTKVSDQPVKVVGTISYNFSFGQ